MGGETKASPDPPELVLHCCVFLLEKRGWVRGWCWRGWDGSIPAVSATGGFHSRTGKCCVTSPGLMGHLEVQALTVTKTITETNCPWATLLVLIANTVSPTSGSPVSESHVGLEGRKILLGARISGHGVLMASPALHSHGSRGHSSKPWLTSVAH